MSRAYVTAAAPRPWDITPSTTHAGGRPRSTRASPVGGVVAKRMPELTHFLKAFRASQPFNFVTTSLVRGLCCSVGRTPEVIIRHLHRVGPVDALLPNGRRLRLWSRADYWVSNQVFWRGWSGYEPETAPLFFEMAQRARLIVDVGAYVGYYSLLGAHANPEGLVLAFEPLPSNFFRLRSNVDRNRLANVRCVPAALGE